MLIEFSCANFKCFADEVRLQLIPETLTQHPHHVAKITDRLSALRALALYGANASGKTKLIEAIKFAKRLLDSPSRGGAGLPHFPFALNKELATSPSRFEFIFNVGADIFTYGFVMDATSIHEEWLFVRTEGREKKCFERITEQPTGKVVVQLGSGIVRKGTVQYRTYSELHRATAPNQLFLLKLDDFQAERAKTVVTWFKDVLTVIDASSNYAPLELRAHKEQDFVSFIGSYLKSSFTGIDAIETLVEDFDVAKHLPGFPPEKLEDLVGPLKADNDKSLLIQRGDDLLKVSCVDGRIVAIRLKSIHRGANGEKVSFAIEDESSGTQRLVHLLPALYDLKFSERVYVIDELDRKLHPLLTRNLLKNFLESDACNRGQLIFTTHETNLLDQELLRRDEIWFVEKDNASGKAVTYPLSDFDIRHDLKLEKGYLNGRFGAIPFFSGSNPFGGKKTCGVNDKKEARSE